MQTLSEQHLLLKVKEGNLKAFERIFFSYEQRILHFIVGYTKSVPVAEDLTQEVFIKVWTNRRQIDLKKNFRTYLFTIAKHLVLNYLRDYMKKTSPIDHIGEKVFMVSDNAENKLIFEEYKNIVDDILNSFPQKRKSIYIMSKQQGRSNKEIASILGVSEKTVKNNLWEALLILKRQLAPYMEYGIKTVSFFYFF